ncbi:MAG: hypothetical protein AAGC55_33735, partial [Myxococcota bacterium]
IWEGKAGSHAPQVTVATGGGGIEALTPHVQGTEEKPGHFITCQFVEGSDGTVFDFRIYTRTDADQVTDFLDVPSTYSGELNVYAYCTEHDLWLTKSAV